MKSAASAQPNVVFMAWTYGDSERLDRTRRRRVREQRIAMAGTAVAVALGLAGAWWVVRADTPPPPAITVVWSPASLGRHRFAPVLGAASSADAEVATLAVRSGQKFNIEVEDAGGWGIHALAEGVDERGPRFTWAPTTEGAALKVFCRPLASGLQKLGAWSWPTYTLRVHAVQAPSNLDQQVRVAADPKKSGYGAWCSANTAALASDGGQWDDRALVLIEAAARAVPATEMPQVSAFATSSEAVAGARRAPRWTIVQGFAAKRSPNDMATYIETQGAPGTIEEVARTASRVARFIAAREPRCSLKLGVSEGNDGVRSVLRISFDGKGVRGGWINKIEKQTPVTLNWWNLGKSVGLPAHARVTTAGRKAAGVVLKSVHRP